MLFPASMHEKYHAATLVSICDAENVTAGAQHNDGYRVHTRPHLSQNKLLSSPPPAPTERRQRSGRTPILWRLEIRGDMLRSECGLRVKPSEITN